MDTEAEEEAQRPNIIRDPKKPSMKAVDSHNMTHLPFRDWCPYCVQGGAPNRSHVKQDNQGHDIPHIACDYCFHG